MLTWTNTSVIRNKLKWQKPSFGRNMYLTCSQLAGRGRSGCFWLHFYSLCIRALIQTCEARCQQLCNRVQGGLLLQAYTQILEPGPTVFGCFRPLRKGFLWKIHAALMQNRPPRNHAHKEGVNTDNIVQMEPWSKSHSSALSTLILFPAQRGKQEGKGRV